MARAAVIHFRSTPRLDALIQAELDKLKAQGTPKVLANRSVVIRTLLEQSLEDAGRREAAQETISRVWYILQKSLGEALDEIFSELRARADEELATLEEAWDRKPRQQEEVA